MRALASWCVQRRWIVVALWVAVVVAAGAAAGAAGTEFRQNFRLPQSDSQQAVQLLKNRFRALSGDSVQVVLEAPAGITAPATRAKVTGMLADVARQPYVIGVGSPYGGSGHGGAIAPDGRIAFATAQLSQPAFKIPDDALRRILHVAQAARSPALNVQLEGPAIEQIENARQSSSEAIGLLTAIVVLLLTFGSVVAMGLPVITALVALGTGLSLVTLATHLFDVSNFTPALAAMIGLGVGIDYALFVVTRFRTALRGGRSVPEAVIESMDTSGRAVLFAGITVVIALLGMFALGITFLYGPAVAASLAVGLTMIGSLTLLPALLAIIGPRIDRLKLPFMGRARPAGRATWWLRWSRLVQRRPWPAALASLALLLVLAIPALSMQLGSADAGTDPPSTTTRQAYDLLAKGFGPGFNGPLQVVAALPRPGDVQGVAQLRAALVAQPGVAAVTPPLLNPERNAAVINVFATTSPQSERTKQLVERIRSQAIPRVRASTGIEAHVGGSTAIFDDFASLLARKLPLFFGIVIVLSALLLMAVFRSVLIPLKAVLMNLLSIGAALGVVVAIFQWGWLAGPLGIDKTAPIASFLPVMVFAIVFGLSMDYEVFLMSRIHEEWERRGDAEDAVVEGLAATGRVITAAATIMVCVFASFALGDQLTIKLFGIALATAVFLDAFVIRSVLVPAIMALLGRRAWWLPSWLGRLLPRLNVEPADARLSRAG